MIATLHGYVLRELLKVFGLALVALTLLFTMGGGLYNAVSREGVSAGEVLGFVPLLVPIFATLTMPMAALFAVTLVYGRLAADNELTACRAAGINVHRLLLSVVLLAVFVAAFTLLFGNFVLPDFAQRLERRARQNVRDLVAQSLERKGFVHRGRSGEDRYMITAERVQSVSDEALRRKGFETGPGLQYLLIQGPTFLHIDDSGALVRFAVAEWGLCIFDVRPTPLELTILGREARDFEIGKRAVVLRQQQIGPIAVPLEATTRFSTAELGALLRWRQAPWQAPGLSKEIELFRAELARQRFFTFAAQRLAAGPLTLHDEYATTYTVTAGPSRPGRNGLELERVTVEMQRPDAPRPTRYEAERAELLAAPLPDGNLLVTIELIRTPTQDVLEYHPRAAHYEEPRHKPTVSLDGALAPPELRAELADITPAAVLDPAVPLPLGQNLSDRRIGLWKSAALVQRKIAAAIHFRLGYAASILVTAVMGAALGVIFRGARALAAVALAMIPFFSVMILMVLGRQLTEDEVATRFGPLVTWGGLGLALLADGVIVRLGVRR